MHHDEGGVLAKVLGWLLVLMVAASIGVYAYVRTQEPLALSEPTVGWNDAVQQAPAPEGADVVLTVNGQIYVATTVRNTGRLPVTLQGLGDLGDTAQAPYIPVEILLSTGASVDPASAATFSPVRLAHQSGVGVLVVYAPNPDLVCRLFTDTRNGPGTSLQSFPIRYATFGIDATQVLSFAEPVVTVAQPTQQECESATGT